MADLKYGRIFTEGDLAKIMEVVFSTEAPDHWWDGKGNLKLDVVLKDMDDMEVRFKWEKDEPIFVLRAHDSTAEGTVRYYRDHQRPGAPSNHLDGIDKAVGAFRDFRTEHPELIKDPD